MPFKSQRQRKWMHANKPAMAKRWEGEQKRKRSGKGSTSRRQGNKRRK